MKKITENRSRIFFLSCLGITALSFLFRFYNFEKWIPFGMDQEYQAFIARNIASGLHFPLIGVNASDTGLYLGPFFSYFTAFTYIFFHGDPIGWAFLASLWGVVTTLAVVFVAGKMFSKKVALFAGFFYAGSFLISFYDRQYWNPTPIPFLSLLTGFFIYQFLRQRKYSLILLSLTFAIALQCHLSILIFLPVIGYFLFKYHTRIHKKELLVSVSVLLMSLLSQFIFEIRHGFQNTTALLELINTGSRGVSFGSFAERVSQFIFLAGRLIWVPLFPDLSVESGQCRELVSFIKSPNIESVIGGIVLFASFLYMFIKHHSKEYGFKVLFSICVVTLGVLLFYNRAVFEYYYLYLFPWFSIVSAIGLVQISRKSHGSVVVVFISALFIILNLATLFTAKKTFSFQDKIKAIQYVKAQFANRPYMLEAVGGCEKYGGYRYLFDYYYKPPVNSYMDSYFSWLYPGIINGETDLSVALLSFIDPRSSFYDVSKSEKEKLKYLTDFSFLEKKQFNSMFVYVLAPKTK